MTKPSVPLVVFYQTLAKHEEGEITVRKYFSPMYLSYMYSPISFSSHLKVKDDDPYFADGETEGQGG